MNFRIYKKTRIFVFFSLLSCALMYSDTTHVVQKGETLYSISRRYNTTVQSVCDANGIAGTDIKIGQKLVIPGAVPEQNKSSVSQTSASEKSFTENTESTDYTVKKGDTWYGIARSNSISVAELYAMNGVDASASLKIGQKIKVPVKSVGKTSESSSASALAKNDDKSGDSVLDLQKVDPHNYSDKKGDSSLVWPVEMPEVTYVTGKVSGVSLSAKRNEAVTAIRSGTVMFSGSYRGFGNVVFIQSKTGHIYAYTGLGKVSVSKGDYIDYKSQIGTAGVDAYTSKPQISLMVFQNGLPIDPAKAPRG